VVEAARRQEDPAAAQVVLKDDADLRASIEATVLRAAEDPTWESELLAGRGQGEQLVDVAS
jgi:hypothetical protein